MRWPALRALDVPNHVDFVLLDPGFGIVSRDGQETFFIGWPSVSCMPLSAAMVRIADWQTSRL